MSEQLDIKAIRLARNWSQQQMAEYLGIDRSSVAHLERGRPASGPVRKLLSALEAQRSEAAA